MLAALASRAAATMQWDLEDYNGWNLPFAKTVQIQGTKNKSVKSGEDSDTSDFMHYLAADSYLMEIDTSALFTVIFIDESSFTDFD